MNTPIAERNPLNGLHQIPSTRVCCPMHVHWIRHCSRLVILKVLGDAKHRVLLENRCQQRRTTNDGRMTHLALFYVLQCQTAAARLRPLLHKLLRYTIGIRSTAIVCSPMNWLFIRWWIMYFCNFIIQLTSICFVILHNRSCWPACPAEPKLWEFQPS